ncbi:PREDICTED: heat shock factor protein 2-like [Tinamus guttatus]|uniref:heat shock factor protein 2-like n=1 Tax=Tinamus guttatus TaxID=94827 RepID=UPI00052F2825|nr:PREDICTED: heat shock factor protein 2-like [Tinamus guttatus]
MASFVRQLNSYGFHKVMQYDSGSAKQERHGSGKYQHPFFRKGQEELLTKIKRKVPLPRIENGKIDPEEIHKMLAIIHHVQGKQHVMDSMLESLKRPLMIDSTGNYNQQSDQELVDQGQNTFIRDRLDTRTSE